jgi:Photosynthesis system II assembly factor YCF48
MLSGRRLISVWLAGAMLAISAGQALCAEKWRVQYFYDKNHSSLVINDLVFPSPSHGVAVGHIDENNDSRPVSIVTDDGGANWTIKSLKQMPISLFFLDDSLGWMVTPKGIWRTEEGGRSWRELPKSPKLQILVRFLDEQHGFAVGTNKSAYQTVDGGKTWEPIAAAEEPKTNPEFTVYNNITFANATSGFINGYSARPRRDDQKPAWLDADAEDGTARREWPHMSIMLNTHDGGKTWTPSTVSMFGRITRAMFLPDGSGLGLIEFTDTFKWPSEVHRLSSGTGKSDIVYNAKDRDITDVLLQPRGAYLAGVEVVGRLQHTPIPRKVKILKSTDLANWEEMDVDYHADATRAMLRAASDGTLWVATDTGMILKLAE